MSDRQSPTFAPSQTMEDLLDVYPGAQRALFTRYHIGGCNSCGFEAEETLAEVCARNEVDVQDAIAALEDSRKEDEAVLLQPLDLVKAKISEAGGVKLVDVRTREEFEAVQIPGAVLLTESVLDDMFANWSKEQFIVVYDHTGERSLDAAAYLIGHGFKNTRALDGGIDRYAEEADQTLPRYSLEMSGGCCGGGGCGDSSCGDGACDEVEDEVVAENNKSAGSCGTGCGCN